MIKRNVALFSIFIIVSLLITGCEKLTASVDGVDKLDTATVPEPVPEETTEATEEPSPESENDNSLTGGSVTEAEEPQTATHTVKMTADGFSPDKLYIKAGDTVVWKNTRYGTIDKAMIIGVRECRDVRSGFLKSGESFSWTFDTPMICTIADGVMTTKESRVYVE